jgi:hypothetical protein
LRQTAEIINLDERRRNTQPSAPEVNVVTSASVGSESTASAAVQGGKLVLSSELIEHWPHRLRAPLAFEDLYPGDQQTLTHRIRQILLENDSRLKSARDQDEIERDEAINRLKIDLATIFEYKGLSAGQEMVIVALYHGLQNKRSTAINLDEYNEIIVAIREMSERPRIAVETALDLIEGLQRVGFNTDLAEADHLHEMICD